MDTMNRLRKLRVSTQRTRKRMSRRIRDSVAKFEEVAREQHLEDAAPGSVSIGGELDSALADRRSSSLGSTTPLLATDGQFEPAPEMHWRGTWAFGDTAPESTAERRQIKKKASNATRSTSIRDDIHNRLHEVAARLQRRESATYALDGAHQELLNYVVDSQPPAGQTPRDRRLLAVGVCDLGQLARKKDVEVARQSCRIVELERTVRRLRDKLHNAEARTVQRGGSAN